MGLYKKDTKHVVPFLEVVVGPGAAGIRLKDVPNPRTKVA